MPETKGGSEETEEGIGEEETVGVGRKKRKGI